jgi:hypothetical protein
MNEGKTAWILSAVIVFMFIASCTISYFVGRSHTANNTGIGKYPAAERQLLDRIGEYESRERDRIARENNRIESERSRIERTKAQLRAIRELDRRSSDLYAELKEEINILADFFRDTCGQFDNVNSSTGGE